LFVILGVVLSTALVVGGIVIGLAFGSDGDKNTAGGEQSKDAKAAAMVACMRENGVSNFPDAAPGGIIQLSPEDGVDINSEAYKNAEKACAHLKPQGGKQGPVGGVQQPVGPSGGTKSGAPSGSAQPPQGPGGPIDVKDYVTCMRSNGVPDFPEPDSAGMFNGIDTGSQQFKSAHEACKKHLPADAPAPK
jgi:hypothetical protein